MTIGNLELLRKENLEYWINHLSLVSNNWAIFTNDNRDIIPVNFDALSSCEGLYQLTRICDSNNYKEMI